MLILKLLIMMNNIWCIDARLLFRISVLNHRSGDVILEFVEENAMRNSVNFTLV